MKSIEVCQKGCSATATPASASEHLTLRNAAALCFLRVVSAQHDLQSSHSHLLFRRWKQWNLNMALESSSGRVESNACAFVAWSWDDRMWGGTALYDAIRLYFTLSWKCTLNLCIVQKSRASKGSTSNISLGKIYVGFHTRPKLSTSDLHLYVHHEHLADLVDNPLHIN